MKSEYDLQTEDERMLSRGRLLVITKLASSALIILAVLAVLIYIFTEPGGEVYISSNVEGARIYMDSYPTEFVTNSTIAEIPGGVHLFSVGLEGYRTIGDYVQRVKVNPGRSDTINFVLEKIEAHNEPHSD
ncbi:MAG: PEGA domain-containing protein [candidate division Zixibacteria bacterium]|nr:PEGA domain-containing protein [Candidatus Tariuqbacter arcticus]